MAVHVDELTTEVVPEEETAAMPAGAGGSQSHDLERERWRALQDRVERDAARTRAEGFDAA